MAKWLGLPVILVIHASAMARSVVALIHGFQSFDQNLNVAAVIFKRIGGPGHLRYLQDALSEIPEICVLGGLPFSETITLPGRRLGTITKEEYQLTPERIDQLASFIEGNLAFCIMLACQIISGGSTPVMATQRCMPRNSRQMLRCARRFRRLLLLLPHVMSGSRELFPSPRGAR